MLREGFNHSATVDFFKNRNWRLGDYDTLAEQPKWISVDSNSRIQLADLYAGILGAAMIADRFGNYEAGYFGKDQGAGKKIEIRKDKRVRHKGGFDGRRPEIVQMVAGRLVIAPRIKKSPEARHAN